MKGIEIEGRTVEEAIQKGLKELALEYKDVEVKILDEGKAGLFGLMGASPARVKLSQKVVQSKTQKHIPSSTANKAKQILEKTLNLMGINSEVEPLLQGKNLYMDIKTEDSALLIGKRGETLDALQLLINLIVDKSYYQRIILDTSGYRNRQEKKLINLARIYAEEVKKTGKEKKLDPLTPHERKIVHSTLHSDPLVQTSSAGEGIYREITISLKKK